jgi:methionyl-tRNA synthetase
MDPEPRRVRREGELGSGRQGGEPRQPHRALRRGQALSAANPTTAVCSQPGARLVEEIAETYEACDTGKVTRLVMRSPDRANEYVEARAPWALRKRGDAQEELRDVCTVSLNLFHQIIVFLAPILPRLAADGRALLGATQAPSWARRPRPSARARSASSRT